MRRYVLSHLPIGLYYALAVFVLTGGWWPLSWHVLNYLWWVLGVLVGVVLLFLDRFVYTYSYPQEQLSQTVAHHLKEKDYKRAMEILDARREEQNKLTFRSALFMVVWAPLSFFALTSTSGLFGKGVVMGLMLHILYDAWRMQKTSPSRLNERLFWQIGRKIKHEEQLLFMWVVTGVFVVFSFWVR